MPQLSELSTEEIQNWIRSIDSFALRNPTLWEHKAGTQKAVRAWLAAELVTRV